MSRSPSDAPPGPRCPICDRPVKPRADNATFPFCSARCKTIDLGKWINEEYRIGAEDVDEDEDGVGSPRNLDPESGGPVRH